MAHNVSASARIHIRPTGPEGAYCRRDYGRGAGFAAAAAGVCVALIAALTVTPLSETTREAILFGAAILGAMSLAAAGILLTHAVLGSAEPVVFAVAPDFIPPPVRRALRELLLGEWDPLHVAGAEGAEERYDP